MGDRFFRWQARGAPCVRRVGEWQGLRQVRSARGCSGADAWREVIRALRRDEAAGSELVRWWAAARRWRRVSHWQEASSDDTWRAGLKGAALFGLCFGSDVGLWIWAFGVAKMPFSLSFFPSKPTFFLFLLLL